MKTPITYYGGKQKLASIIVGLIPTHKLYCEPFLGGGAIFFSKPQSAVEVINDTNKELINFYRVVQDDFVALETMINITCTVETYTGKQALCITILTCFRK
jgi:DNA adenine methylase